ncbi:uncharacterized protein PAC_15583 [Phialocephala subalpina]|uniref:Uncharacterized protein n=1 Tax=Phialocephala subalpina TaxID=576137 RepID=A0A1L7XKZ2_9HELO|nr:uncharacterized protein PAC_15583 [Phialocephala subalpina]
MLSHVRGPQGVQTFLLVTTILFTLLTLSSTAHPIIHRQTLTQQTQQAGLATGGMNEAGKITLLVFMPLAGVMIFGVTYWVCFSDKVNERFRRRGESRKLKKAQKKFKKAQKTNKVPDLELGVLPAR